MRSIMRNNTIVILFAICKWLGYTYNVTHWSLRRLGHGEKQTHRASPSSSLHNEMGGESQDCTPWLRLVSRRSHISHRSDREHAAGDHASIGRLLTLSTTIVSREAVSGVLSDSHSSDYARGDGCSIHRAVKREFILREQWTNGNSRADSNHGRGHSPDPPR